MSGTARLVGHKVEVLADLPIVGPLPTQTVMSYTTINGTGSRAMKAQASAPGSQIIPSGSASDITFNTAVIGTYLPPGTIASQTISAVALSANQITYTGVTGFLGTVTLRLEMSSNKAAFVAPPENVKISIYVLDNIGGTETYSHTVPITVFGGGSQFFETSVTVAFPTTPTRSSVNFYAAIQNGQAADAIVIVSGKLDVTQIM